MNITRNDRLIRRNNRIGLIATLAGLAVLVAGMVISFRYTQYATWSFIALFVGFVLSQVGIYFSNRWGKSPRPDELLTTSLKGLDGKYSIFHYATPVSHLLIGPAGLWILQPHMQKGEIYFSKGRWRQKGGNWYLKLFAQEGLGRPDLEVSAEVQALERFLGTKMQQENIPPIQTALVFYHPGVTLNLSSEEPPIPTILGKELKDFLRKAAKTKSLSSERVAEIQALFEA